MTQDSTFEFERKRNRPERYDRNVAENTLKAIKTISKVRASRYDTHIKKRMMGNKRKELDRDRKEVRQDIDMVKAPSAQTKDPSFTLPKIKIKNSQPLEENHAMEE